MASVTICHSKCYTYVKTYPIPIPGVLQMFDSDSVSSQKCNDSGIDSDSGVGIVRHCIASS